jgi:hypothetical protein
MSYVVTFVTQVFYFFSCFLEETNLKKQGLLPLTFAKSSDYDKIMPDDRISLVNLIGLRPGKVSLCFVLSSLMSKEHKQEKRESNLSFIALSLEHGLPPLHLFLCIVFH